MNREDNALEQAVKRLDRAVAQLEERVAAGGAGSDDPARARLAAELEASRQREKELEAAGAEASAALGRAIVQIEQALSADDVQPEEA
jgi:hypothetical protein